MASKQIVKEESSLSDYERLAAAVMQQATDDWCGLYDGDKPNEFKNFDELKEFFENDCNIYLVDTKLTGDDIFKRVQKVAKGAKC